MRFDFVFTSSYLVVCSVDDIPPLAPWTYDQIIQQFYPAVLSRRLRPCLRFSKDCAG